MEKGEAFAVGCKACPALGENVAEKMPPGMRASMLDGLSGAVVRLGQEDGIPTPVHAFVQAALSPYRDRPPQRAAYSTNSHRGALSILKTGFQHTIITDEI